MPSRRSSASTDWNNRSWGKPPAGLSGGSSTTASGSRRARSGERSTSWRAAGVRTSLRSALGERGERQRVAGDGNTRPGEQARLLARHQLAHQPGLADAGLAGHDDHAGRPVGRTAQGGPQHGQAVGAAGKRTGGAVDHVNIMAGSRHGHPLYPSVNGMPCGLRQPLSLG